MSEHSDPTISLSSVYASGLKKWWARNKWLKENVLLIVLLTIFAACVGALALNQRFGIRLGDLAYGILRDVIASVLISDTVGIFYELVARKSVTREVLRVVKQQLRHEFRALVADTHSVSERSFQNCGVVDFGDSRSFLYQELPKDLIEAVNVRVMAIHGMRLWINKEFQQAILTRTATNIRVLLLRSDSSHIEARAEEYPEEYDAQAIKSQIISATSLLQKWQVKKGLRCQLRLYDQPPSFTLIFVDDFLYLSGYQKDKSSQESAVFKLARQKDSLFQLFDEYYERIWRDSLEPAQRP